METCGTATTGLVLRNSTRTNLRGGNVLDFTDTALRVQDLPPRARIKFWGLEGLGSTTGLAVTNVADGAGPNGARVSIRVLADGGVGGDIVLSNADGIVVEKSNFSGVAGTSVTIDAASANNIFRSNSVHTVSDAGIDTCWKGNSGYADSCP